MLDALRLGRPQHRGIVVPITQPLQHQHHARGAAAQHRLDAPQEPLVPLAGLLELRRLQLLQRGQVEARIVGRLGAAGRDSGVAAGGQVAVQRGGRDGSGGGAAQGGEEDLVVAHGGR